MSNNHKHVVFSARNLSTPPRTPDEVSLWLIQLVEIIEMKLLMGPYSILCTDEGNEGVTGIVVISTSHASLHSWSDVEHPFFEADLYSCRDFDVNAVIEHCRVFGPEVVDYTVFDRNFDPNKSNLEDQSVQVIDKGKITFV